MAEAILAPRTRLLRHGPRLEALTIAALLMLPWVVKEGLEALEGDCDA